MNFKKIHIGALIKQRVTENDVQISRICSFFKCSEEKIVKMYETESLDSKLLLKWSKLLGYDFFRIYSQHLILFAPQDGVSFNRPTGKEKEKSKMPQFRKNIYTKELIDFILELLENEEKTKLQIINEYKIPKTTLYKWISKYKDLNT
ncbi:hypothetical protein CLA01_41050 [Chryseobacterium lathyri]|uniref:Uncharacterized protein n=2 Tax=Chryseobacterium lathyri TaxID=395933 RepID=A0A511YFT4_9FLAO|nr:transposase [Chryseobacterium lathyri]GEN74033.1 hypothetical protein CLA01_41050 [Chryseobacterium lathyri]